MLAFRITCALLLCGIPAALAEAQQPPARGIVPAAGRGGAAAGGAVRQPRPPLPGQGQQQAVAPIARPLPPLADKALVKILDDWGNASAQIRELRGEHRRFVFEDVFKTEKRSVGHFYYMAPDKGRIDLEPVAIAKDDTSRKKGYKLLPDRAERWICDGNQIITINDEAKEYEKFPLPVEMRGQNIINGPLPFLFGLKANEAHARFELELIPTKDPTKVVIVARPRQPHDQANYSEARILLDTKANLPDGVRLVDPAGTRVTEYFFENLQPNGVGLRQAVEKMMGRDPFHPNVNGYKTVQKPAGELPPGTSPPARNGLAPAPRNALRGEEGSGKARLE